LLRRHARVLSLLRVPRSVVADVLARANSTRGSALCVAPRYALAFAFSAQFAHITSSTRARVRLGRARVSGVDA
jgi:hypothetical protein